MFQKIYELECLKKEKEAAAIKKEIKTLIGEHYFTDESPMFHAIDSGVIQTSLGNFKCQIRKI